MKETFWRNTRGKKSENTNSDGKMLYLMWLRNLRQLNYSINRWGGDDVWGHEHILGNFWSHGIPGIFMWNTRNDTVNMRLRIPVPTIVTPEDFFGEKE